MKGFTIVELLVVIGIILILLACLGLGEPIFRFAFGWILFLVHNLPEVRFRPAAFVQAIVAFVLLLWATHSFLGWFYGRRQLKSEQVTSGGEPAPSKPMPRRTPWRFRWSAACVVLVVVMFVAGISMIVLVHQVGWLFASDEPWMTYSMSAARRVHSSNNLKQLGLAVHNYHDTYRAFPPGGTFNRYSEMQHGWITHVLPFMEQQPLHDKIQWDLPWDHAENAGVFSTRLDSLRNPSLSSKFDHDERGYALSHYAANARVVKPNGSLSFEDISDGTSNTILAGEVQEDLQPWGSPLNWRDPTKGINRGPNSFGGGRTQGGAQFVFADGSVHYLPEDTDLSILKALATPAGGEQVELDW
jgi:prepilin-type N-terminal cleavage/methylation domain-containing protein/prepilin-type processing-associated H-X9-DG protein